MVVVEAGVFDGLATGERGAAAEQGMLGLGSRCAPEGHDGVADEFIDGAAMGDDDLGGDVEVARQQRHDPIAHALGKPGETCDIDEHHSQLLDRAAGLCLDALA